MLALMVDLEEDEEWSFSDDIEDTDMERYLSLKLTITSLLNFSTIFLECTKGERPVFRENVLF